MLHSAIIWSLIISALEKISDQTIKLISIVSKDSNLIDKKDYKFYKTHTTYVMI